MLQLIKGNQSVLNGRVLAFARVTSMGSNDLQAMVHHGMLAVQGNYRDQRTLEEFFKLEFGLSLERGFEQVFEQNHPESTSDATLDPEQVKERFRSMRDAVSNMPIPAKHVVLESPAKALEFEGDVADLGEFDDVTYAHMAVNAFPILYQAYFRQQEHLELQQHIDRILEASPHNREPVFTGDVETQLLHVLLPTILYAPQEGQDAQDATAQLHALLAPHLTARDTEEVLALVGRVRNGDTMAKQRLDLLLRRTAALHREDIKSLEAIRQELELLDR
jgi:hypothetical protein